MFDLLIRNGTVIDGSGQPRKAADVGVSKGKISAVGDLKEAEAGSVIDASGKVVCPGFIDYHSHSDVSVFESPENRGKVLQGITTDIGGMCGSTLAPLHPDIYPLAMQSSGMDDRYARTREACKQFTSFGNLMDAVSRLELGNNMAIYAGHSMIRMSVMGLRPDEPDAKELDAMKGYVEEAMQSGAMGLSFGLIYPPSVFGKTPELIALCKAAAKYGRGFTVHMRSESDRIIQAIGEVIEIAQQAGTRAVISHHKIAGRHNWGKSVETLRMIEEANARGIEIGLDQYPYTAGATSFAAVFPPRWHTGGTEGLLEAIRSKDRFEEIKNDILTYSEGENLYLGSGGFDGMLIAESPNCPQYVGKTIGQAAKEEGADGFELFFDILIRDGLKTGGCYFLMGEEDIVRIMQHPLTMIGTDAGGDYPTSIPRAVGTFPRVLGRYIREQGVMTLEEGIRKMTSLPAGRARFASKGLVREGMDADLVVFDPETISDHADYTRPSLPNTGIFRVIVGGAAAVEEDAFTGVKNGKLIRANR